MPVNCKLLIGTPLCRTTGNEPSRRGFSRYASSFSLLFFIILLISHFNLMAQQCMKDLTDTQPFAISTCGASGTSTGAKAFDNSDDAFTGWKVAHNPEPGSECWIQVRFASTQVVRGYSITELDDKSGNTNIAPSDWQFQGSNDGLIWITLDTRAAQTFSVPGETHVHAIANTAAFTYYRFFISQTKLTSSTTLGIAEIQLFDAVCITGTVFRDGGDRLPAYNPLSDLPMSGVPVKIVTSPAGTVVASTVTNAMGKYTFTAATIPTAGSFSVIMTPPAGNIFVCQPANLWSTWVSLPSPEEEPPAGSVFFDYHVSSTTGKKAAWNRMRFPGGNLDFGMAKATPPPVFVCSDGNLTNMITEGNNGTFGNSSYVWEKAHPWQKGFVEASNILYSSIPASATSYGFSSVPTFDAFGNRGVLLAEGIYCVNSFPGTISDLADVPYTNSLLNNVAGGWRKTYGVTTADPNDQFLAINGATAGSLPFFKQGGLALGAGVTYTLAFYGKHANSYAQVSKGGVADGQIVVEVMDNSATIVTSGALSLSAPTSYIDDRPESPWQLRMFSFTAPGAGGPYTIQLRASTLAAYGNDFYIDNIVLYPCSSLGVLPVQITSFTVKATGNNDVQLNWSLSQQSPGSIEIQHSTDGRNFATIGSVEMDPSIASYAWLHSNPGYSMHYYRLKITDAQGVVTYSAIETVAIKQGNNTSILIYPNPVSDILNIQSDQTLLAIEIIDATGKTIKNINGINANQVQLNISQFASGVYLLKITGSAKNSVQKIVVRK